MSVMLVAPPEELGAALTERLVSEGDEVRVVEESADRATAWKSLGAHVARGSALDDDLLERAATNARTIVLFDPGEGEVTTALAAARASGSDRVVICSARLDRSIQTLVTNSGIDHVYLITGRSLLGRTRLPHQAIAEAIDAADDIAGDPRMTLDLRDGSSWSELGLQAPR